MIKLISLPFIFLLSSYVATAQSPGQTLAQKIAGKMKDSLSLTDGQKNLLYEINIQLFNEKKALWDQYANDSVVLQQKVQQKEMGRDSLYRPILGEEKYGLYKQKKSNLVNNN